MTGFVSKCKVLPEQGPRICEFLVDDNELEVEGSANPIDMIMLLLDMVPEHAMMKFQHKIDYRHWGSTTYAC